MDAALNVGPALMWVLALVFGNKLVVVDLKQLCGVHVVHDREVSIVFILLSRYVTRRKRDRGRDAKRERATQQ